MGWGFKFLIISLIILLFLLITALVVAFTVLKSGENYDETYQERVDSGELINPIRNLTEEEAILSFNESFVYYLLYSIKAYNLHESITNKYPLIEIQISEEVYNALIEDGEIIISRGSIENKDGIIITSKEEAIKMLENKEYIKESFYNGDSRIELIADNLELASKGYLSLYTELTGETITGAIISNIFV